MNNPKLYTVKEAAKVVGVSTNTLYKYLDDGKIKAARGTSLQGRFRIPESALEEFLGISLSTPEPASPAEVTSEGGTNRTTDSLISRVADTPISPTAHLPLKLARALLLFALVAMLVDLVISREVSLLTQLTRFFFLSVLLLLAYQEGGYRRHTKSL